MNKEITIIEPSVEIITEPDVMLKLEQCMRVCYKSEDRIKPGSADKLVKAILERNHTSTIEHVHVTLKGYHTSQDDCLHSNLFDHIGVRDGHYTGNLRAWLKYFASTKKNEGEMSFSYDLECALRSLCPAVFGDDKGIISPYYFEIEPVLTVRFICDRGISHELVRHRVASFSQESTRYCNYSGAMKFIKPCFKWAKGIELGTYNVKDSMVVMMNINQQAYGWLMAMDYANKCYNHMIKEGCTPQEARSVLPNSLKTEVVMTATYNQWVDIFKLRLDPKAHPQMQQIMLMLKHLLPQELRK